MGLLDFLVGSAGAEASLDEIRSLARSNTAFSLQMAIKDIEAGKSSGAFAIGSMFESGQTLLGESNFPKSHAKALSWKLKAANDGNEQAQTQLGYLYFFGETAKGNIVKKRSYLDALQWFSKAAGSGGFYANYALGEIYLKGFGVACDNALAFNWFQKSINHRWAKQFGFYDAAARMAEMYADGQGTQQDFVQSYKWGNISGLLDGRALGKSLDLKERMTASQIDRALVEAAEWLRGAAPRVNTHPGYLLAEGCWPPSRVF